MTAEIRTLAAGAIALLAGAASPEAQLRTSSRIVEQPDAPVQIVASSSEYQKRTNEGPEGIRHELEFRSQATQKIVAVQFGLISFDIWNEYLARLAGLATEELNPKARKRGVWLTATDQAVGFLTAVVYVDRVRFESGEIWIADRDQILTAMRAIQKNFDPENLVLTAKK